MINKLELVNFKKHESLSLDFTSGLNVFRAENEKGKSTVYHAIAYALWGTRALPDSFEETVTWGKKPSELRVRLEFTVAGILYKIVRSKSGAELTSGTLVVSGQAEVTAHVERLTGANMAVGMATLLAAQGGLQASLDGSAVALIEKLSNMSLIDALVSRVQEKLPSGNTKLLEVQLAGLSELVEPAADFSEFVAEKQRLSKSLEDSRVALATAESKLAEAKPGALAAQKRIDDEAHRQKLVRLADVRLQQAMRNVQWPVEEEQEYTAAQLESLQALQKQSALTLSKWRLYSTLPLDHKVGTVAEFKAKLDYVNEALGTLQKRDRQLYGELQTVKAATITDKSCSLCGRMLDDVPEVVSINAKVAVKVAELTVLIEETQKAVAEKTAEAAELRKLLADDKSLRQTCAALEGYVTLSELTTPPIVNWNKEILVPAEIDNTDYTAALKKLQAYVSWYSSACAVANAAELQVAAVREELADMKEPLSDDGDVKLVADFNQLSAAVDAETVKVFTQQLEKLELQHISAIRLHQEQMKSYKEKVEMKTSLTALLSEYNSNNALIKKLREARPIVARELWNLVLQGVSHTFSQIRGVPSVVTRSDTKFLIDGKSASVYSGSTKDALGLAIRIMLQKTFLPNISFILLDEVAAGADEVREVALLATLASAGFPQSLLVTHSELADTFASNLITL